MTTTQRARQDRRRGRRLDLQEPKNRADAENLTQRLTGTGQFLNHADNRSWPTQTSIRQNGLDNRES